MARRRRDLPATTLRVTARGYEPISAFDQEIHARYRIGSTVEAELHQEKSNPQLRLYWSFLSHVVEATGKFGSARALSNAILVEAGYVESFTALVGGGVHAHPMSLAEFDQAEFDRFVHNAFALIYEMFGVDVDEFKRQRARNPR